MFNFMNDHVIIAWSLFALGIIAAGVLCAFACYLLYHTVRGFIIACSFTRFCEKAAKADGRVRIFRAGRFLTSWVRMIGWRNGSTAITLHGGHRFYGFNNYVIVGKFVSSAFMHNDDFNDLDEED